MINMNTIQNGDEAQIRYTTSSREGGVVETSKNRTPFSFQVGSTEVISGINRSVLGMKVGERKRITLLADETFGHRESKYQQLVPLELLPEGIHTGDQVSVQSEQQQLDAWVIQIDGENALLDFNHPLVGEMLVYEIEVVGLIKNTV